MISGDVACLPRHVYKRLDGGGLEVEADHPAEVLVGSGDPNDEMGKFRFTQTSMGHVLGRGNGYSEIVRKDGYPVSLETLHPVKTIPKRTASKKLIYELDNKQVLAAEDVLHFAGLGYDGVSGYCPITLCRQSIGVGIATEQFGASFFGNGAIPAGVLKHPRRLGEAALSNLRKTINQVHQGSQSAHQLLILEEGMDYADRQISPEDSQYIDGRKFTVLEVGRLFRCPPHKLGDYSQSHLSNIEESNLDYLATTILTWVCMLDDEFSRKLLTRDERKAGLTVLTDLRALMRGNTAVRTNYYNVMRNMGSMSADDIRIAEGMNPLPAGSGGDLYLVQAQYVPLKDAGKAPTAQAPPPGSAAPAPAEAPPAVQKKARRMNENHDEAGRFAEGDSGGGGGDPKGGGGGSPKGAKIDAVVAKHEKIVNDLKEKIAGLKDSSGKPTPEQIHLGKQLKQLESHLEEVKAYQEKLKDRLKESDQKIKALKEKLAQSKQSVKEAKSLVFTLPGEPARRMNENHDEAGRFAEGDSGGGAGDSGGKSYDDHPDVQQMKADHADQKKEWDADHAKDLKELARDQAKEVKGLEREQAKEAKALGREQAKEAKALEQDQAKERAKLEADPDATPEDRAALEAEHASAREDLAASQRQDRDDLAEDHAGQLKDLAEEHAEAIEQSDRDHAEALEQLARDQAEELAEVVEGLREDDDDE